MPKRSLAKLEHHLYGAADRLRQERLDAAMYKDYILEILFLKLLRRVRGRTNSPKECRLWQDGDLGSDHRMTHSNPRRLLLRTAPGAT